jgi:hypothetical protein
MAGDCVRASDVVLHVRKLGQTRSPARLPAQPANGQPWPHTIAFCYVFCYAFCYAFWLRAIASRARSRPYECSAVAARAPGHVRLRIESIITAHNGGDELLSLRLCLYEAVCRHGI